MANPKIPEQNCSAKQQVPENLELPKGTCWQDLIPEEWNGVHIDSLEDLADLGRANLAGLKRYWRREERELNKQREKLQQYLGVLNCGSVATLKERAAEYEHPEFPSVGFMVRSLCAVPTPLDDASMRREAGATTLNFCGWCKYADGTQQCKNFWATSRCGPMLPWQHEAYGCDGTTLSIMKLPENLCDTPCLLMSCADEQLALYAQAIRRELRSLNTEKERMGRYVNLIMMAAQQAEQRPCFTSLRPEGWFSDGDEVVCLVHDCSTVPAVPLSEFVTGRITYSSKRWTVSVGSDQQLSMGSGNISENSINLDYCSPAVMSRWEYDYLCEYPFAQARWIEMASGAATKAQMRAVSEAFRHGLVKA